MGYLREQVFARDKGICAECGIEAEAEWKRIQSLRGKRRWQVLTEWRLQGRKRRDLWDADHIIPVVEGGGECDLSNIRTLCLKCHRRATAELRDHLRARRRAQATSERLTAGSKFA
ncbi:MAG: HNH endonuclease signature motif containing protein [Bryobacterales bacterium]|nr:HNH endonuclease signature motif containing protein [Bryobacterales bacterium]